MRRYSHLGVLLLLFSLVGVGVASAATCSGYGCRGLDPSTTQCNQYYNTMSWSGATLTNWYSTSCNGNWAQGYLSAADVAAGYSFTIDISTSDDQGYEDVYFPSTHSKHRQLSRTMR